MRESFLAPFALAAALAVSAAPLAAQQSHFWLQHDGASSQHGTVTNPVLHVQAGNTLPLYLWFNTASAPLGFDGVSLDVRLQSSDGGQASAAMTIDMPPGRWTAATAGTSRTDSGGTGINDSNAFDLTNTNTVPPGANRFATLDITGVSGGTVQLFLCVGAMGIADSGQNAVVWFGFAQGSTLPETLNISGGVPNLCSNIADATIHIVPNVGDLDGDGDVDQEDFGLFQACLLGPIIPQTDPACQPADLTGNGFVDQEDFAIFHRCMTGPNLPIDYSCAD